MYSFLCAHVFDEAHVTDEAKLACSCEPCELPISTFPVLGLLTAVQKHGISGLHAYIAKASFHRRCFLMRPSTLQWCKGNRPLGKHVLRIQSSVLAQASTMHCRTLAVLCSSEPHRSQSAMWVPAHSTVCHGAEAWHLISHYSVCIWSFSGSIGMQAHGSQGAHQESRRG